ncbi:MAG: anthrone oxygenase family protein [Bacteroidota bacterium]
MALALLALAVASAVMGGMFYAFSSFIMTALGRIPPAEGIRAMQRINVDVFRPSFMALFFGIPVASVVLAGLAIWRWDPAVSPFAVAAAVVCVVGCFVVTAAGNVPLNNALERADAETEAGHRLWADYLRRWTRWNTVRTVACLAAAVLLLWPLLP